MTAKALGKNLFFSCLVFAIKFLYWFSGMTSAGLYLSRFKLLELWMEVHTLDGSCWLTSPFVPLREIAKGARGGQHAYSTPVKQFL